jgi:hypothetical protein
MKARLFALLLCVTTLFPSAPSARAGHYSASDSTAHTWLTYAVTTLLKAYNAAPTNESYYALYYAYYAAYYSYYGGLYESSSFRGTAMQDAYKAYTYGTQAYSNLTDKTTTAAQELYTGYYYAFVGYYYEYYAWTG